MTLEETDVDVLVIGAGIQGAGVAQAAAAEGYRVRVVEQYETPAEGTSSRSSKLIHGGLRYLETGQLPLVYECLQERALLLKNAPDLVKLVPFNLPIYLHSQHQPLVTRAGLSLYALLGGLRNSTRFRKLSRAEWHHMDGLTCKGLQAVYRYHDAQTDDRLLTEAVLASAVELGAEVSFGTRITDIELRERSADVGFDHHGTSGNCRARVIVIATGPWVNSTLAMIRPQVRQQAVDLVQGSHILLPGKVTQGIYYVEAPHDRRPVFVIPWQGRTLVGTTETPFEGDPADTKPLPQEIDYLLETYNRYFPGKTHSEGDILESFSGLRVLPKGSGKALSRPRESILFTDRAHLPRMACLVGGKLTAYRAVAEHCIARVELSLPQTKPLISTKEIKLSHPNAQCN